MLSNNNRQTFVIIIIVVVIIIGKLNDVLSTFRELDSVVKVRLVVF